jgi:hypothetical protein
MNGMKIGDREIVVNEAKPRGEGGDRPRSGGYNKRF